MNLSAPFIERPVMTTLLVVALLCAGIASYLTLPLSNMPNVTYPTITVQVSFPGTTPDTMAQAVALPLEKQFMAIPGVKLVSSTNTLGNSLIVLQFEIEKNMNTAAQDVQAAIITATPSLPPGLPYAPVYRKVNPSELPIVYIALTSPTMPLNELYTYANSVIGQRISMLKGVSQVTTFGSPLAVRIQVNPSKMAAVNLSLADLNFSVTQGNANLSTGQLNGPIEAPNISVDGQLVKGVEYDELIAAYRQGSPIRIKDIGRAIDDFQNQQISTRYLDADGIQPALLIAIQKEPDGNAVTISDQIQSLLEKLKLEIPASVEIRSFFDRSISIREAIDEVKLTLVLALIFVVIVIFLYFGKIADTLIPAVVLPMSVIATFIVMDYLGYTLDNLSLLALTLAVGFIVDDAIVVMENIVRIVEKGKSPWEASMEGAKQIGFTIVSMTLSLIAVFIPMLFMGGLMGKIFQEFAVTLTAVTIISGILSLTLTPMLCSRFIPARQEGDEDEKGLAKFSKNFNKAVVSRYRKALEAVIDHQVLAFCMLIFCMIATGILFRILPSDFIPEEDVGFFIVYVQGAESGSSARTFNYETQVLDVLRAHPAVESAIAICSYSEYRKAQNLVRLKPKHQRGDIQEIIRDLNAKLKAIPGIQVFTRNIPLIDLSTGPESRGNYQYALHSIYGDKTYPSAKKLIAAMKNDPLFEGVNSDLEIDSPQINISILRDKASSLGITALDIESIFLFGYSNNRVTRINTPVDQYDVIIELNPIYQREVETFNQLWLRSSLSQKLVPLSAVATWQEELGAASISHINQFPSVTIDFNLGQDIPLETALKKIHEYAHELVDPAVTTAPVGTAETFQESTKNATILLFVAVFSIYIILGMLYESFFHPLTVLTTLPPAAFGGLLTLLIFGLPLSMYGYLGIILLIGIVQKNGIMIIDFAIDNIRTKGMSAKEAIISASLVRFRPIMMTTMAAIAGAIPIAWGIGAGSDSRRPLGLVIIGGLLFAQLVTLFITPILYLIIEKFNRRFTIQQPPEN